MIESSLGEMVVLISELGLGLDELVRTPKEYPSTGSQFSDPETAHEQLCLSTTGVNLRV